MGARTALAVVVTLALVGGARPAQGADIRVLASNGIKAPLEAIEPEFERVTGHTLTIEYSTAATLKQRIEAGEAFDVAVLTNEAVADLIKSGALLGATRAELAAVGIGVGVRSGAARPDIRTAAGMKASLLGAKAVAYTRDGATRPAIDKMFAMLGITHEMETRSRLVSAGQGPPAVARGESDMVITLSSEILPEPGVVLVGPVPADFQMTFGFSAAAASKTGATPPVQALIRYLDGPVSATIYTAKGMDVR